MLVQYIYLVRFYWNLVYRFRNFYDEKLSVKGVWFRLTPLILTTKPERCIPAHKLASRNIGFINKSSMYLSCLFTDFSSLSILFSLSLYLFRK